MYELETMIAAYLAIIVSLIITLYFNHQTLKKTDQNIELSKKSLEEIKSGQLLMTYPFLSQRLGRETVQASIDGTQNYESHYVLYIKNFGNGPAVNQDSIKYEFKNGEVSHQGKFSITGAHDIIAPEKERELDLTVLSKEDWRPEIKERYDSLWIRLPHEDVQRNKCCNCTKYNKESGLLADFGKEERYWYYSAIPEISSPKCKNCEWKSVLFSQNSSS